MVRTPHGFFLFAFSHIHGEKVKVRAPKFTSDEFIEKFVTARTNWIIKKLEAISLRTEIKSRKYVNGEKFPYLGRDYSLNIVVGCNSSLKLKNGIFEAKVLYAIENAKKWDIDIPMLKSL